MRERYPPGLRIWQDIDLPLALARGRKVGILSATLGFKVDFSAIFLGIPSVFAELMISLFVESTWYFNRLV